MSSQTRVASLTRPGIVELCRWLDVVGGNEDVLGEGGEGARAGDVADERRAGVAGESRKGGGEVEYK